MAGNDMPSPATFLLTRNAALDMRRIYTRSRREWGEDVADQYLADLYAAMGFAAANPEKGRLRQYRSAAFLMFPSRQHFVISPMATPNCPTCGRSNCSRQDGRIMTIPC